jgi:cytochrome c oxidase cbb3-type subunit 4
MEPSAIETAATIDMGFVRGLITLLTMAVFFGITWWAYHRGNRERFEADAMLPFAEDDMIEMQSDRGEGER